MATEELPGKMPPQSAQTTIVRVARVAILMQWMCVIGSLVFTIELFMQWDTQFMLATGEVLQTQNTVTFVEHSWPGSLARLPYAAAVWAAFFFAFQTFGYLKRGDILTELSAISLNRMSLAALFATFAHIITGSLGPLLDQGGGFTIAVSDIHLVIIFLCLILLAISWILREASEQLEDVKLIF